MNQVDEKPIKPRWFVIVEIVLSLGLLYGVVAALIGLTSLLKVLGSPPMIALILAAVILIGLVYGVILPNLRVRK